jgi:ketosteroid isomerase-like protein
MPFPSARKAFLVSTLALAAGFASGVVPDPAAASTASDLMSSRILALGAGDVADLTAVYGDHAALLWVGGPLDGRYQDVAAIAGIWQKFAKAQGPSHSRIVDLTEATNPQGSTVTANLVLTADHAGGKTLKVHYVTVWRGDRLVDEIWQLNPQADC